MIFQEEHQIRPLPLRHFLVALRVTLEAGNSSAPLYATTFGLRLMSWTTRSDDLYSHRRTPKKTPTSSPLKGEHLVAKEIHRQMTAQSCPVASSSSLDFFQTTRVPRAKYPLRQIFRSSSELVFLFTVRQKKNGFHVGAQKQNMPFHLVACFFQNSKYVHFGGHFIIFFHR